MEYIERDALLAKQQMDADLFKGSTVRDDIVRRDEALNAVANIVNAPAADVAPVRHGKWIIKDKHIYQCSRCGNYLDIRGLNGGRGDANYCPNCGAKME